MSENITISGEVKNFEERPIFNIKVTIYRRDHEIDHVFTDEKGKYDISIPKGDLITIRFDTHFSVPSGSGKFHPSVVANLEAKQDFVLNRFLLETGFGGTQTTFIDALTAYEFAAFWEADNPAYAEMVVNQGMGMMKLRSPSLASFLRELQDFFRDLSKRSD